MTGSMGLRDPVVLDYFLTKELVIFITFCQCVLYFMVVKITVGKVLGVGSAWCTHTNKAHSSD